MIRVLLLGLVSLNLTHANERARDLGIRFSGTPGTFNAITDVAGVAVSHITVTQNADSSEHVARTGITAIFPKVSSPNSHVAGSWNTLNGNGEMTGTTWLEESGDLEGPILLTNTYSVGLVRDAVREWANLKYPTTPEMSDDSISLPIVAETYDGFLNDINGHHITKEHVFKVLENPSTGPVEEGNVGGGTGTTCFEFKGGIGTASRQINIDGKMYTVGILVQTNFGERKDFLIEGIPMAEFFPDLMPIDYKEKKKDGSMIAVLATDAPLLPHQLKRLTKRISLGMAKTGAIGNNGSGDIFIAFSTTAKMESGSFLNTWQALPNEKMDELFRATIQVTEEAIINSLVAAKTMTGVYGNKVFAIPHQRLAEIVKKIHRH